MHAVNEDTAKNALYVVDFKPVFSLALSQHGSSASLSSCYYSGAERMVDGSVEYSLYRVISPKLSYNVLHNILPTRSMDLL